jgi:hypothetical protein
MNPAFKSKALLPSIVKSTPSHMDHFASPMVHPATGETISSYKKIMNIPATAEIWQLALFKILVAWCREITKQVRNGPMLCL